MGIKTSRTVNTRGMKKWLVLFLLFLLLWHPVRSLPQELTPDDEQAIADAREDVRKKVALEWSLFNAVLPLVGLIPDNEYGGFFLTAAAGVLGLVFAVGSKLELPSQRIMGKSSIYLERYGQVFRELMVSKRVKYAFGGCCVTGVIVFLLIYVKHFSEL